MALSTGVLLGCPARVMRVIDGNTLDLETDLGSCKPTLKRCRLYGVEAPDLEDSDPEERKVAEHAKDFVEILVLGKEVVVRMPMNRRDEHGRWRAVVHWRDAAGDWSNLNEDLIENGLAASTFAAPKRPPCCHGWVSPLLAAASIPNQDCQ